MGWYKIWASDIAIRSGSGLGVRSQAGVASGGSRLSLEVKLTSRLGLGSYLESVSGRESGAALVSTMDPGTRVSPLIKSSTDLEISLLGVVSNLKKSVKDRNFKLRTAQTSINTICWVAIFQGLYKPV
ncbi:hypothetical protein HAX54_044813 [Datura stramonium]|uniref:Uncharacterized protein n=1 Tax=Datura stramonium TaxID=4076 RepID=A0ABS8WH75_DATST|nr:hypothetical protein [Datura stramonium]